MATPIAETPRRRIAGTTARSGTNAMSDPTIIHVAVRRGSSASLRRTRRSTIATATTLARTINATSARAPVEVVDGPHDPASYVHHDCIVSAIARQGAFFKKTNGSRTGSE